ncbi:hypothetical protein BC567DRAFT_239379 [Phyllosticta citribraziliensis]
MAMTARPNEDSSCKPYRIFGSKTTAILDQLIYKWISRLQTLCSASIPPLTLPIQVGAGFVHQAESVRAITQRLMPQKPLLTPNQLYSIVDHCSSCVRVRCMELARPSHLNEESRPRPRPKRQATAAMAILNLGIWRENCGDAWGQALRLERWFDSLEGGVTQGSEAETET